MVTMTAPLGLLEADLARIARDVGPRVRGRVARVSGHEVEVRGLRLRLGDAVTIEAHDGDRLGEVIAISSVGASVMVYGQTAGIGQHDPVALGGRSHDPVMSVELRGRVIDALGSPIDGGPDLTGEVVSLESAVHSPLKRQRISERLGTGLRVLDGLCPVGKGQRLGIFGGSGVGKSTLLGMLARGTAADVTVLALVGERGREVREFVEEELGPDGLENTIVVVATSDEPALVRLRAAKLASRIATWFADRGDDVLLLMDSLTRVAHAQREIGLAAGEPPTARGFTPSVFSLLPHLIEQAGPRATGTVTGLYTVLVDGDDMNDPIADAARGLLDGHIVLDRRLANAGRFPAIDALASLSRLGPRVAEPLDLAAADRVREVLSATADVRELVEIGAYVPGSNPVADLGLAHDPFVRAFLEQPAGETVELPVALDGLHRLSERLQ